MRCALLPLALAVAFAAVPSVHAETVTARAARLGFTSSVTDSFGRVEMVSGTTQLRAADGASVEALFQGELGKVVGLAQDGAVRVYDVNATAEGRRYYRARQTYKGLPVWGDGLTVQTDAKGYVEAVFGATIEVAGVDVEKPRGVKDLFPAAVGEAVALDGFNRSEARNAGKGFRYTREPSLAIFAADGHAPTLAWDAEVSYESGARPFHSRLFVDARSGQLLGSYTLIREAINRAIHNLSGSCVSPSGAGLPGPLAMSEGGSSSDSVVNQAYRNVGRVYWFFRDAFGRDSFNGAGAKITVSVKATFQGQSGCSGDNAFWSGSQIAMGQGGSTFFDMNSEPDVMYHELGHAVTQYTSNLVYQKESGGLNEATSDIYAAAVEAWMNTVSGEPGSSTPVAFTPDANTWNLGEGLMRNGTTALRYMHDPRADGRSLDHYQQYQQQYGNCSPSQQNDYCGVHTSSGIANLAFYLLTVGGTHPRGTTTVNVPKIPFERAIKYLYEAHVNVLQSNDTFSRMRNAMMARARANGTVGVCDEISIGKAWDAVGVSGSAPSNPNGCSGGGNQSPVAAFTATPSGLSVAFNGSGSSDPDGSIASYAWSFGDGTNGSGATVNKTYSAAGTYTVSLTVTDNQGATNTRTQSVTVTSGGGGTCPGASFNGSFSGATGQTQYQPNGNYYQTTVSGTHTVCLMGPAGTDFDIYLDKWNGFGWSNVAKSEGETSSERISYNGSAGYYVVRVVNFAGTGSYTLSLQKP
ncbi:M4 family metallopeptidase [Tahibacter amnicola]|uniref:M4 family metallopeptidase n=1 Tax=Tahibacter amnicola TaxID=2976241 RepID=A0ABY6BDN7_9GAMM|nr:M4 family metallopeptidase [Tahibacter amnicola]UXI67935.1 M4 family metallopeptidase [Tahibacter amnicola]